MNACLDGYWTCSACGTKTAIGESLCRDCEANYSRSVEKEETPKKGK